MVPNATAGKDHRGGSKIAKRPLDVWWAVIRWCCKKRYSALSMRYQMTGNNGVDLSVVGTGSLRKLMGGKYIEVHSNRESAERNTSTTRPWHETSADFAHHIAIEAMLKKRTNKDHESSTRFEKSILESWSRKSNFKLFCYDTSPSGLVYQLYSTMHFSLVSLYTCRYT